MKIEKSIHTFELTIDLSAEETYEMYHILKYLNCSIQRMPSQYGHHFACDIFRFTRFENLPGINAFELIINKDELTGCRLKGFLHIIINLGKVNDILPLSPNADIVPISKVENAAEQCFNALHQLLGTVFFSRARYSRIDFCVNLKFPSQNQAMQYIHLWQKAIPSKCLSKEFGFNNVHTSPGNVTSLHFKCKYYEIAIYLKEVEMLERKHCPKDLSLATGIVRIELRAKTGKLVKLSTKGNCSLHDLSPENLCTLVHLGHMELKKKLTSMVGSGDFYKFDILVKKIEEANLTDKQYDNCIYVIYALARYSKNSSSIINEDFSRGKWKKVLHILSELNCSVVPVPRTAESDCYPGVDTIYSAIKKEKRFGT